MVTEDDFPDAMSASDAADQEAIGGGVELLGIAGGGVTAATAAGGGVAAVRALAPGSTPTTEVRSRESGALGPRHAEQPPGTARGTARSTVVGAGTVIAPAVSPRHHPTAAGTAAPAAPAVRQRAPPMPPMTELRDRWWLAGINLIPPGPLVTTMLWDPTPPTGHLAGPLDPGMIGKSCWPPGPLARPAGALWHAWRSGLLRAYFSGG